MSAARRLAAATASVLGLAILLVGVPLALGALVGWPLPHSWPSWAQVRTLFETSGIPDVVLIDSLAVVCWIAWLDFAVATVVEIVSAVAGYPAPRLRVVRPWQPLAARLITMIILAMPLLGTRSQGDLTVHRGPLAVALSDRQQAISSTALPTALLDGQPTPPATGRQPLSRSPATSEYVVRGGDTLWGISTRDLRNPRRWPEIWRNNAGRAEPGPPLHRPQSHRPRLEARHSQRRGVDTGRTTGDAAIVDRPAVALVHAALDTRRASGRSAAVHASTVAWSASTKPSAGALSRVASSGSRCQSGRHEQAAAGGCPACRRGRGTLVGDRHRGGDRRRAPS